MEERKWCLKKKKILCRSPNYSRGVIRVSWNYIMVFSYVCFGNWSRPSSSSIIIKFILGRRRVQQADENDKRKWNRKKERRGGKKKVEEEDKSIVIDGGRKILISTPRCFFLNNSNRELIINGPADSRSNPTRNTREKYLLLAKSASLLYPTLTMKALRVNYFFPQRREFNYCCIISDTKLQAIYFLH